MRESIGTVQNLPVSTSYWIQNWHMILTNRCELRFRIRVDILFIILNSDLKINVSRSLNNNIGLQSAITVQGIFWQFKFPWLVLIWTDSVSLLYFYLTYACTIQTDKQVTKCFETNTFGSIKLLYYLPWPIYFFSTSKIGIIVCCRF